MIPKRIITTWLTFKPKPWPALIQRCLDSQKLPGYEQFVITIDNSYLGSSYVNEAIDKAKRLYEAGKPVTCPDDNYATWLVKASDWLRCYHTCDLGGIYLDADMEVIPGKNFDDLLDCDFFTETEVYGLYSNCGFGSIAGHWFLKEYLKKIEDNFLGTGVMVFEPGIRAFADQMWATINQHRDQGIKIYDTKLFHPYQHGSELVDVKPETKVYHHYAQSWAKDQGQNKLNGDYYLKKVF
jgi:hypothetical protein